MRIFPTISSHYFNFETINEYVAPYGNKYSPSALASFTISLSSLTIEDTREVYSFLDFLGDIGGIFDILVLVVGYFINPVSEFSFTLKAIKVLYHAKNFGTLNQKKVKKDMASAPDWDKHEQIQAQYQPIQFSFCDKVSLFLKTSFC